MNTDSLHPNNIVPHNNNPPNSPLSTIEEVSENTNTPTEEVVPLFQEKLEQRFQKSCSKEDVEEVKSDSDSEDDSE